MSDYTYTDEGGDRLKMQAFHERVHVITHSKRGEVGLVYVANADAPTVAAELLKAAGQKSVIVPKSTAEVVVVGDDVLECGDGPERAYGGESHNPNWLHNKAANYIAIAEYIESAAAREATEKAVAEAAEKKLQERRDALVDELGGGSAAYGGTYQWAVGPLRRAVDRIIALQDEAAK